MHLTSGAARYREILAGKVHQTSVNGRASGNHTIGRQVLFGHAEVRGTVLGEETDLLKAVAIYKLVYALPGGELPRFMLLLEPLFAAAFLGFRPLLAQFADSLLHRRTRWFEC